MCSNWFNSVKDFPQTCIKTYENTQCDLCLILFFRDEKLKYLIKHRNDIHSFSLIKTFKNLWSLNRIWLQKLNCKKQDASHYKGLLSVKAQTWLWIPLRSILDVYCLLNNLWGRKLANLFPSSWQLWNQPTWFKLCTRKLKHTIRGKRRRNKKPYTYLLNTII